MKLTLPQWTCGDSFFTKCSSCSFDRALHGADSLLNPVHSSIRPRGKRTEDETKELSGARFRNETSQPSSKTKHRRPKSKKACSDRATAGGNDSGGIYPRPPSLAVSSPTGEQDGRAASSSKKLVGSGKAELARNAKTGETIPIPL